MVQIASKADISTISGTTNVTPVHGEKAERSSWRLLRNPRFRLYFLGSLVSNLGTWLQKTAQVLLAYQLTHSVFAVGLVVSAQFCGIPLLSPWAAVLASRIGSRKTLVATQCVSAAVACAMGWRYHNHMLGEHSLLAGALALGFAFSLALPVQTALVSRLVEPGDVEAAMAMNSVSYNSGRALAPALSILVIAFVGPDLIFAINGISFVIFAIVLSLLSTSAVKHQPSPSTHVADGLRIALHRRRILLLLAIVAAVTLADDPVLVLSPSLTHTTLHVSSGWAGYFIAALGGGAVLGSLFPITGRRSVGPSQTSRRAAWSLLALSLSVVVFTAGVSTWVTFFAAFTAGTAALLTGAAAQRVIVGRRKAAMSVAGLWAIAWAGTKPMASLLDGWLASHVGILLTGIVLASPAAVLALCELWLPRTEKRRIKNWSLSNHLETTSPSPWGSILYMIHFLLRLLDLDHLPGEEV